ncbi:MAG TPA: hypothetical protein PL155_07160 [Candidatus Omnitrophota bacterium]|nr:hypothetical protein [Candidatus Omnitrophota bacterium]HPD85511.1 hypothetical protein [Candidatus Omnitrophota bacterium]HRZ04449.1 hypothetical protein [Candidatus Omnitrophota bacterium]
MKKIALAILLSMLFSTLSYAEPKKELNASELSMAKITLLQDKISGIEEKFELRERNNSDILVALEHSYSVNVSVFIALTFFFIAVSGLLQIVVIKNDLKRDVNKVRDEIRQEFSEHTKKLVAGIKTDTDTKFKTMEEKYLYGRRNSFGYIYNALGRIHETAGQSNTAVLWFGRGLKEFIRCGSDKKWIKTNLWFFKKSLNATEAITDPDDIKELVDLIDEIDSEEFKSEKEELTKLLKDKIAPEVKDKSSEART